MSDFRQAFKATGGNEGGFANNPDDAGGMTVFGIARAFWPRWGGWRVVDQFLAGLLKQPQYGTREYRNWVKHLDDIMSANAVLMGMVESFYQANFWDNYRIGEIQDQALANWLYDHAVNGGGQGVKWMQEAAGVTADGSIGAKSLQTFNSMSPFELLKKSEILAAWYRLDKVKARPSQAQFLNSWLSRDGVDQDIIDQARAFARDGLSDEEVAQLKEMVKADALGDIKEATA